MWPREPIKCHFCITRLLLRGRLGMRYKLLSDRCCAIPSFRNGRQGPFRNAVFARARSCSFSMSYWHCCLGSGTYLVWLLLWGSGVWRIPFRGATTLGRGYIYRCGMTSQESHSMCARNSKKKETRDKNSALLGIHISN